MADSQESDAQDTVIHLDDDLEVKRWALKLDSTAEQIKEAVDVVGARAADVEMHLKGTHATTNADQEARADRLGDCD